MNRPLRLIFMGTPEFAVESLDTLKKSKHEIIAVVTAPDKPAGRGGKLRSSTVKQYCEKNGLAVWQPTNLKDPDFVNQVVAAEPDLIVVVAFRMLPRAVWQIPPKGTINLHASLLPDYRGAAPINWAIINGESKTGVTTFFINEKIDTGDIIDSREVEILPEMDAGDLHDRLKTVGAELLVETVDKIFSDKAVAMSQLKVGGNDTLHDAPKINKENSRIDWNASNLNVINLIRGMSPFPGAYTELEPDGTTVKIFKVRKGNAQLPSGAIETDGKQYITVGTSDGSIEILELQISGKKRMPVRDFLNGFTDSEKLKRFK